MKQNEKELFNQEIILPTLVEDRISDTYQMIREKANTSKQTKKLHRPKKKIKLMLLTAAVLTATTVTVMAVSGVFEKETVYDGDHVSYLFDFNYKLIPGNFTVTENYVPEGYEKADGFKYYREGEWGHGFHVSVESAANLDRINQMDWDNVEEVKKMTLSGMEAERIIFKEADKYQTGNNIYLFNEKEGYVVWVWGDYSVPADELEKVADNLVVTRVGDAEYDNIFEKLKSKFFAWCDARANEKYIREQQKRIEVGIPAKDIIQLGEEGRTNSEIIHEDFGFTVKSVEYKKSISEYNQENFYEWDELAEWLNEDGTLRPYTRQCYEGQYARDVLLKEETMEQEFMVVKLRVNRYEAKEDPSENPFTSWPINGCIERMILREDGSYTWPSNSYASIPSEGSHISNDFVYFSDPQNTEGDARAHKFFWIAIDEGSSLEYTLIYVVDAVRTDPLFLKFDTLGNNCGWDVPLLFALE